MKQLKKSRSQNAVWDRLRIMRVVKDKVKGMVEHQLKTMGFDQDLTVGDLSTCSKNVTLPRNRQSYAGIAATTPTTVAGAAAGVLTLSKEARQESKFWKCRRAVRM